MDGIAVDAWGGDFALLDSRGEMLGSPRHFRDPRLAAIPAKVWEIIPRQELFRQTGIQTTSVTSLQHLFAIARDSPETLRYASKLLFMPGLFNYFLTGVCASERTVASTSQFYNPVGKQFATDMLRRLGIPGGFFAELLEPGTELGPLLLTIADRCGIRNDVPVRTTASYRIAAAVAAVPAAENESWCYINSGDCSQIGLEISEPLVTDASLECHFSNQVAVGGRIRLQAEIPGTWPIHDCRRAWAAEGHPFSYSELIQAAAAAAPISSLIDLDQLTHSGNLPNQVRALCRRTQQPEPQDQGSTVRLLLHSLAARYKQVIDDLETLTNRSISVIHIVGSGSRNSLLNRLIADASGRHVIAGPVLAAAAGNALTQAMGTGDITSLEHLRAVVRRSFELEEFAPSQPV